MSVQRYKFQSYNLQHTDAIVVAEDGDMVKHTDYAALEARCGAKLKILKTALDERTAERDAEVAKLAAAEARADAFHAALVKARPCGVCGGSKQIVSKRSQEIETCPGCNGYGFDLSALGVNNEAD